MARARHRLAAAAACLLPISAAPSLAHHSTAIYDTSQRVTLTGVVKEFQYTNPHIWIQLDVTDENGETHEYGIEGGSPNFLKRRGWTARALEPGDEVSLLIYPLHDGQRGGTLISVTLADGSKLEDIPPPGAPRAAAP
jgi:hypothetical protein